MTIQSKTSPAYKEAFDIICLTEFEYDGGEESFDVTPKEKRSKPYALSLIANNVAGDYWKTLLARLSKSLTIILSLMPNSPEQSFRV